MVDKVIQGKTRTRREFCSFYTESDPILTYMVDRLAVEDGDLILEPCAGNGIFIEKIRKTIKTTDYKIDAIDLNSAAVENLEGLYGQDNRITIRQVDTLIDPTFDLLANMGGHYSKVIGNPPYGAWQDYGKRNLLKKLYHGYVRETYTLFLQRCLSLLKNNGKLVFIIPDTFLALHLHKRLREELLKNSIIKEVLLIPSHFFPSVSFGYSNLCIISLIKSRHFRHNKISIISVTNSVMDLYEITSGNYKIAEYYEQVSQEKILAAIDYSFLIGGNSKIRELVNKSEVCLGDIADCVTGFYSGDNRRFMAVRDCFVKGSKGYDIIDEGVIDYDFLKQKDVLSGLKNAKKYIPILKGGKSHFVKDTEWFIRWDQKTVEYYKKDKKARFQNPAFYFKEGIGVPMVKSNGIYAFLLQNRLFDQSVVGIFPRDPKYLHYILAFLNSDICSQLLKTINHTANNSANYLKKLPIILDSGSLREINAMLSVFWKSKNATDTLEKVNRIFDTLYGSFIR